MWKITSNWGILVREGTGALRNWSFEESRSLRNTRSLKKLVHQQQMGVVGIKIKVEVTLLVELLYERERENGY